MSRSVPEKPGASSDKPEPEPHMHFWIETGRHIIIGTVALDVYDCRDCGETLRRGDRAC